MTKHIPQKMSTNKLGKLYVVATPIGNLKDFSIRAQTTLQDVSWIACEDTRHCQPLLKNYGISTHCISLHSFNEKQKVDQLIRQIQDGESAALISDAGTPVISDPGYHLIRAAHEGNIQVVPIPGPNAAMTALCALAIQEGPFYFEGFLSSKTSARKQRLKQLSNMQCQLIFYEAPHRIKAMMKDMLEVFGPDRLCGIARELTKLFETLHRGNLAELNDQINSDQVMIKGEFVVIVEGASAQEQTLQGQQADLIESLLPHLPINTVAKITSKLTSVSRKEAYDLALMLQDKTKK